MGDEPQRDVPAFNLRRFYRSEPRLNEEVARGEATSSLQGAEHRTGDECHSNPPLSLSHRRSAPTPLFSLPPIRQFHGAATRPRGQPTLGPSSFSTISGESPQKTTGFVSIESPSAQILRADTSSIFAENLDLEANPETSSSEASMTEDAAEMNMNAEEGETSRAARGSKYDFADASAKAKKKEDNRLSSARTRRRKKEAIVRFRTQKESMEATIKWLEDEQRKLRKEHEVAHKRLDDEKAFWNELERRLQYQEAEGTGEVETDRSQD